MARPFGGRKLRGVDRSASWEERVRLWDNDNAGAEAWTWATPQAKAFAPGAGSYLMLVSPIYLVSSARFDGGGSA